MPNKAQNTTETPQEPDDIDKAILKAASLQPNKPRHAIARNLVNAGVINNVQLVYDRLKRRDYLSREFEEIQQNHREAFSRELMPIAIKRTRKALKTLNDKDVFPYVQLTAKTTLGDHGSNPQAPTINIEHLERMQVLLK